MLYYVKMNISYKIDNYKQQLSHVQLDNLILVENVIHVVPML